MNAPLRLSVVAFVALLAVAAIVRLSFEQVEYRVDLHAVLEIWSDIIRDVENVPLTITRLSAEEEMALGNKLHQALWPRMGDDPDTLRYLAGIGDRLAEHAQRKGIRYQFHFIDDSRVNAHALPGGHVYVTRGLLELVENEAELASVIGHEISHVDLRHCVDQFQYQVWAARIVGDDVAAMARMARLLFRLGFSEQQEIESDTRGMLMASAAGYDPGAAIDIERKLIARRPDKDRARSATVTGEVSGAITDALGEYFDTHPTGKRRIAALRAVYRRNAPTWRGDRFYVGKTNVSDLVPFSEDARDDEWRDFREPDEFGVPPSPTPPATIIEPPAAGSPPDVETLHPVDQWYVTRTNVVVWARPVYGAYIVGYLDEGEDVYVSARVGDTAWRQVRARLGGEIQTGYLREGDLIPPAPVTEPPEAIPAPEVGTLHPVNQWNITRTKTAIKVRPLHSANIYAYLDEGDDIFVSAWVGDSTWLQVRLRLGFRIVTGYIREGDLRRPVHRP